jgi:hypothetical protein
MKSMRIFEAHERIEKYRNAQIDPLKPAETLGSGGGFIPASKSTSCIGLAPKFRPDGCEQAGIRGRRDCPSGANCAEYRGD